MGADDNEVAGAENSEVAAEDENSEVAAGVGKVIQKHFPLNLWVRYLQSYSQNALKESRNSLCKILEELEIGFLIFVDRLREDLLTSYLQKCL